MLAFVFGGGGSRGALQMGALQVLLENDIHPDMVIGTSVGATNAAFFAADPTIAGLEKLQSIWLQLGNESLFPGNRGGALLRFIRGRASLYPNDIMVKALRQHLERTQFGELTLPCYAVAIDLDSGEIVTFGDNEEDLLEDGLMSSMALIPAHPPWQVGERRFVDGGYGAVLPVRQAVERGATQIIALRCTTDLPAPEKIQSAYEIMVQTSELMIRRQAEADLVYAREHINVTVIDLPSDHNVSIDDFSQTEERFDIGRKITSAFLDSHLLAHRVRALA